MKTKRYLENYSNSGIYKIATLAENVFENTHLVYGIEYNGKAYFMGIEYIDGKPSLRISPNQDLLDQGSESIIPSNDDEELWFNPETICVMILNWLNPINAKTTTIIK